MAAAAREPTREKVLEALGRVIDPAAQDPDTVAIREFNERLRDDARVDISLVPMADGITLIRKKTS